MESTVNFINDEMWLLIWIAIFFLVAVVYFVFFKTEVRINTESETPAQDAWKKHMEKVNKESDERVKKIKERSAKTSKRNIETLKSTIKRGSKQLTKEQQAELAFLNSLK